MGSCAKSDARQLHFPASASFQNVYAPEDDPEMRVERYDRTWEQNESLGLNDMKTEDYGEKELLCPKGTTAASSAGNHVCTSTQEQAHMLEMGAAEHKLYTRPEIDSKNLLSPKSAADAASIGRGGGAPSPAGSRRGSKVSACSARSCGQPQHQHRESRGEGGCGGSGR